MNIIIDTHVLLWFLAEDEGLSAVENYLLISADKIFDAYQTERIWE